MTNYYVIGTVNHADNKLYYLSDINDSYNFTDILHAKKFNHQDAVIDYLKVHKNLWYLGIAIVMITDTTLDKITNDKELFYKYHNPCYVL